MLAHPANVLFLIMYLNMLCYVKYFLVILKFIFMLVLLVLKRYICFFYI